MIVFAVHPLQGAYLRINAHFAHDLRARRAEESCCEDIDTNVSPSSHEDLDARDFSEEFLTRLSSDMFSDCPLPARQSLAGLRQRREVLESLSVSHASRAAVCA